ncbi:RNB domain-containing ribonuclease [Desulfovibrio sp. OttesenSCG-928-G15]|nr:RNB domain-containing ribonuclease [Desulfovibrio sp. OttesenSCG-928-G15]
MARHARKTPRKPVQSRRAQPASTVETAPGGFEDLLASVLHKANRPLSLDEILRITHLSRRSKKSIENSLHALQDKGRIVRAAGGWAMRAGLQHVTGTLALQRAGMGFVTPEKGGRDIYIHPSALNGAWHGDSVEVLVLPGKRGPSIEGRIVRVIMRGQAEITAHAVKKQDDAWVCVPTDNRIPALFLGRQEQNAPPVKEGDLLVLKPGETQGEHLYAALITGNLEHEDSPSAQERIVKIHHSIPGPFPPAVLQEVQALPPAPRPQDLAGREDLTALGFVTIDGRNARDFDDAIFVEEISGKQNARTDANTSTPSSALPPGADTAPGTGIAPGAAPGFRLYVAIADVAHYVPQGSALDAQARLRGNSCYFPLSVEPMLPEALSNGLCSLNPGVPRLVMVADMHFNAAGARLDARFYPAFIQSAARLTYGQIERGLLLGQEPDKTDLHPFLPMLSKVRKLAEILLSLRLIRGGLDFDLPESQALFSPEGRLTGFEKKHRHFGHRMIEECMLAANAAVAELLRDRSEGTLYRVHQPPDPDKLLALRDFLYKSGLVADFPPASGKSARPSGRSFASSGKKKPGKAARSKNPPSATELCRLLTSVRGSASEYVVTRLMLRSMMQAMYQCDNEGHYGLALRCYCHFTSPIRRYADLVVHRSLKHALGLEKETVRPLTRARLESIALHINETERTAAEAEREIARRLSILFMQDRVGEHFSGTISGVTDFALFVELSELAAEGMIRLSSLPGDYYDFLPERQELRGRATGKTFRLGMPIEVALLDASLTRLEMLFAPAHNAPLPAKERSRKKGAGTFKKTKERS